MNHVPEHQHPSLDAGGQVRLCRAERLVLSAAALYRFANAQYALFDGERQVGPAMKEVSLAISSLDGKLHRHGDPKSVQAWYSVASARLRAGLGDEFARALILVTGPFPLDELNRCVADPEYAGVLLSRLDLRTAETVDFA